jgi:hypothetical protein
MAYTIEIIDCSEPDDYTGQATTFFDGTGGFNGSFFTKNYGSAEYANLSGLSTTNDYDLGNNSIAADPGCNGRNVHTGTWLKKLVDTTNQHSNGFNTSNNLGRQIGNIVSIVFEARINSNKTDVPTSQELIDAFATTIGEDGVATLDGGKVAFGLTLNNPDANDTSVRGEVYFEIDQDLYADQWVRITIPKDNMFFWRGANYIKEPVALTEANNIGISSVYLNPETKGTGPAETHGFVVRNVYGFDRWTTEPPVIVPEEDFKEMNISIRTFEIRYEATVPTGGAGSSSAGVTSSSSSPATSSIGSSSSAAPIGNGVVIESLDFEDVAIDTVPAGWGTFIGYVPGGNNNRASGNFALTDNTRSYSGTKSLYVKAGGQPAQITKQLPAGLDRLYTRMWVYSSQTLGNDPSDNHEHFTGVKANENGSFSANNEIRIGNGKGHLGYNIVPSDAISPNIADWGSGPQTPANQWYCVEVGYLSDLPYNETSMWIDGVLVNSVTSTANWHQTVPGNYLTDYIANARGHVFFGWHSFSGTNADMWFDDIVVATDRIGCN